MQDDTFFRLDKNDAQMLSDGSWESNQYVRDPKEVFDYEDNMFDFIHKVNQYLGDEFDIWKQYQQESLKQDGDYEIAVNVLRPKLARLGKANLFCLFTCCIWPLNRGRLIDFYREGDDKTYWIYERCKQIEEDRFGFCDIWPRGHYKSTLVTKGTTIQLLLNDPDASIGIMTHTKTFSQDIVKDIRAYLRAVQWIYPDIISENFRKEKATDSASQFSIRKSNSGSARPSCLVLGGTGGSTGVHVEYIIFDDLMHYKITGKTDQINKIIDDVNAAMQLNTTRNGGTKKMYIGTPYHKYDVNHILMTQGKFTIRYNYALSEQADGTVKKLFFNDELYENQVVKANLPKNVVAAQYFLEFIDIDGTYRLSELNIQTFDKENINTSRLTFYCVIDPAYTVTSRADETGIVVVGVTKNNKFLIFELCGHKVYPKNLIFVLRELDKEYNFRKIYIEGAKKIDADFLKARANSEAYPLSVSEFGNKGITKRDRIFQMADVVNGEKSDFMFADNLQYKYRHDGNKSVTGNAADGHEKLIEQWNEYRGDRQEHDDILDVLASILFVDGIIFCDYHLGKRKKEKKVRDFSVLNQPTYLRTYKGEGV